MCCKSRFVRLPALVRLLSLLAAAAATAELPAEDWPNFRGPNHDGVCRETGLRIAEGAPPQVLWEQELGSAFSSFAVVGGRLYTCGTRDGRQTLYCLDAATGQIIWQDGFEKEYPEKQGGDGTRATPTVHDGRVYVLGARGRLVCYDANSGELQWDRQFQHMPTWGYSGSVLIEGDMAVVSAGESDGALAAFERKTGAPLWKTGTDPVGYATPYPFTHDGVRYIAGFLGDAALIVRAADGTMVWRVPWKTDWKVNASAPLYRDGYLLFSSGYRHGAFVVRLSREGGALKAQEVWSGGALRNKFQSVVPDGEFVYTCDETGLKCVELRTGKVRWHERRAPQGDSFVHGTVVLADGKLFVLTENGTLLISQASPDRLQPLTQARILSPRCWTVPVIANGRLYARNMQRVVCLDLRGS